MSRSGSVVLSVFVVALVLPAFAAAETITFELEPIGIKPNGSLTAESDLVRFSVRHPDGFVIEADFGVMQFRGTRGLAAFAPDDSVNQIILDFAVPVTSLSLWFGNDPFDRTAPGDAALLQVFAGATLLGQSTVLFNRNDIMDQVIGFAQPGISFTRAVYQQSVPRRFLALTIDDVSFTPVPEPATLALVGGGLVVVWRRRHARRSLRRPATHASSS